jgi:hypothetical protein
MEFQGRGYQSDEASEAPVRTPASRPSAAQHSKKNSGKLNNNKWARIGAGIFGLLLLALAVWAIIGIAFSANDNEADYVNNDQLQAVFLQTGQVYFGKISTINDKYIDLGGIYYLQTSSGTAATAQSTDNTNVSLVKLGCELHAPKDQMIITRDQVTFWENLSDSGQVAKAVATFEKDNPNGQKCSDTAASSSSTNVQGSTNTPAPTDTTKKQ